MNDRMYELINQCFIGTTDGKMSDLNTVVNVERFARLIVQECMLCCEQVISDPVPKVVDTWLNGGEQCIQEIKEHFGVEE